MIIFAEWQGIETRANIHHTRSEVCLPPLSERKERMTRSTLLLLNEENIALSLTKRTEREGLTETETERMCPTRRVEKLDWNHSQETEQGTDKRKDVQRLQEEQALEPSNNSNF